jgi:hypothetical protein
VYFALEKAYHGLKIALASEIEVVEWDGGRQGRIQDFHTRATWVSYPPLRLTSSTPGPFSARHF